MGRASPYDGSQVDCAGGHPDGRDGGGNWVDYGPGDGRNLKGGEEDD